MLLVTKDLWLVSGYSRQHLFGGRLRLTLWVNIKSFLSRHRMSPNNRMFANNRFSPHSPIFAFTRNNLLYPRMCSFQSMQSFLEPFAQTVIGFYLIGEERIASYFRHIEDVEECCSRWLELVGYIAVPCYWAGASLEKRFGCLVACSSVDEMDFGVALTIYLVSRLCCNSIVTQR